MGVRLNAAQRELQRHYREFAAEHVTPAASRFDSEQKLAPELIVELARGGFLAALVPADFGGKPVDFVSYGLMHEELGRACSSTRSLITVHSMVCLAIDRWGTREQRTTWLPALARGDSIAAFALTEPNAGSDTSAIETNLTRTSGGFRLNGKKTWITCGQLAGVFLVFAKLEGAPCALLVPGDTPGFSRQPIFGMLGCRASMLAELTFDDCEIPESALLGRPGFGLSHVAQSALDNGRYSIAWGCVGLLRACVEASVAYANERRQSGAAIVDQPLVRRLLTNMVTELKAARLLCWSAALARSAKHPNSLLEVALAKYYASTAAARVAADAVQVHGARGCSDRYAVERWYRDAKIMEIIEGSTQIQQSLIAAHASELLDSDEEWS